MGTWNDYMLKLRTFYRWIYNSDDEKVKVRNIDYTGFVKIKKELDKRITDNYI
ncbi:MAG: hypothetical protein P0116_15385 [Candidatus Nitrosocosmicus sp.]|nr:hypothetical protein [Candidatus Nitrosocosmicus sp.]